MTHASSSFLELTQGVTARLTTLRSGAPDVMKSFGSLGRAAMADGALSAKNLMYAANAIAAFDEFSANAPA